MLCNAFQFFQNDFFQNNFLSFFFQNGLHLKKALFNIFLQFSIFVKIDFFKVFQKRLLPEVFSKCLFETPKSQVLKCFKVSHLFPKLQPLASTQSYLSSTKVVKGPSLYYVRIFWAFLDPTHLPYQHKYSTERQQNWPFFGPTHPVFQLT